MPARPCKEGGGTTWFPHQPPPLAPTNAGRNWPSGRQSRPLAREAKLTDEISGRTPLEHLAGEISAAVDQRPLRLDRPLEARAEARVERMLA
jgi:hypothetical protein